MRSTSLIARSVAPRSSAPASDVTNPPSNAASTAWPSTIPKSNRSALHCVGIGALLESMKRRCGTTTFADSEPRCAQWCEKCGLDIALTFLSCHQSKLSQLYERRESGDPKL